MSVESSYRFDPVAEVEAVHADLAEWLGSDAPPEVLDRFAATQHAEFSMVTTSGALLGRDQLLAGLRGARNSRPGLTIEIDDVEVLVDASPVTVVRFLERHRFEGVESDRRTTAVLVGDTTTSRPQWRSLHETAVPADR
jgi:hypothetical protein